MARPMPAAVSIYGGIAVAWIKLTDPSGNPVQLSSDQMVRVRVPPNGDTDPKAKAVIDLSNAGMQAVTETVDQVMKALQR